MSSGIKFSAFIITGFLIAGISVPTFAEPMVFGDDTLRFGTEKPFRDESADFYARTHYDTVSLANSVQQLTEIIYQRMGKVQTIRTALKLEGHKVIEAKIMALNQIHNDLTFIRAAGAIGPDQPFIFLNKLTRTFASYMEGMDYSLKNSMVLPVSATAVYAYAEEMFYILHQVSKLLLYNVHWHQHSLQLTRVLTHLKNINNSLLKNADTIGLLPQALVDFDDVLTDKTSEIQEYGADRDVFRALWVQTHQTLKKRYVNNFLNKKGLPRDSYPKVEHGRQRPDYNETETKGDNYYLDSDSASGSAGAMLLPFR
ncbi:hypothetical protein M3P05_13425 [Sansalvadorimonas sp. 2012CJ34-2]|uniref:Uncharacterized protein n=1 Tax=Parendozoicomonas callyspongiae TaxID=2942213 RepID=A0ABT0PHV8_9GAMM|nr:hypothetical protein [Sansalvadorimonas sp. 2012CJ34-2]MCL6270925.1 hypothetical protein [Sansalvadorimonas sp. 2012CJ34-2]